MIPLRENSFEIIEKIQIPLHSNHGWVPSIKGNKKQDFLCAVFTTDENPSSGGAIQDSERFTVLSPKGMLESAREHHRCC